MIQRNNLFLYLKKSSIFIKMVLKTIKKMDIQELIKFVAKSGATEVDLEIDNVKISIKSPPKKRRGKFLKKQSKCCSGTANTTNSSSSHKHSTYCSKHLFLKTTKLKIINI